MQKLTTGKRNHRSNCLTSQPDLGTKRSCQHAHPDRPEGSGEGQVPRAHEVMQWVVQLRQREVPGERKHEGCHLRMPNSSSYRMSTAPASEQGHHMHVHSLQWRAEEGFDLTVLDLL